MQEGLSYLCAVSLIVMMQLILAKEEKGAGFCVQSLPELLVPHFVQQGRSLLDRPSDICITSIKHW